MTLEQFITKYKEFVANCNQNGIPFPMVRDPKTGKGSITATMVVVSFFLTALPSLIMLATVITKLAGIFTLTDANEAQLMNSFQSAIQLFIASLGAYLGRKFQKDENSVKVE